MNISARHTRPTILVLLLCLIQISVGAVNQLQFHSLSLIDGIPNTTINCITQDSTDAIWIGTDNGCVVYDGSQFIKIEDIFHSSIITNRSVTTICPINTQLLLIGTNNGVYLADKSEKSLSQINMQCGDNSIENIISICHRNDTSFIADAKSVFLLKNKELVKCIHLPDTTDNISSTYVGSRSAFLIGTENGNIWKYDYSQRHFNQITVDKASTDTTRSYAVTSFSETPDHDVLFSTWGNGLYISDATISKFSLFPAFLPEIVIRTIIHDKQGNVWAGTLGNGLIKIDSQTQSISRYTNSEHSPESISNNSILSLFLDNGNMLWAGTWGDGVSTTQLIKAPQEFLRYNPDKDIALSSNKTSVVSYNDSTLFIGTFSKGLNIYSTKNKQVDQLTFPQISNNVIQAITHDQNGNSWIGTSDGLNLISKNNIIHKLYAHDNIISNNNITALETDALSNLFIGYRNGDFSIINTIQETQLHYNSSKQFETINCFYIDKNRILWTGTKQGLFKIDILSGKVDNYNSYTSKTIPFDIRHISESDDGSFWLSTFNNGLVQLNRFIDSVFVYNENTSVLPNTVYATIQTKDSAIIIGTSKGLFSFDKSTKTITPYTQGAQMYLNEYRALCNYSSGLFASATNGVDILPLKQSKIEQSPSLFYSSIHFIDTVIYLPNYEISVDETQTAFSVTWGTSNYGNTKNQLIKYRLKGLHDDWYTSRAGTSSFSYTNVSGGEYTLEIMDRNYPENIHKLSIYIGVPLWKQLWFQLIIACSIIALITYIVRQQISLRDKQILHLQNQQLKGELDNEKKTVQEKSSEITMTATTLAQHNELLQNLLSDIQEVQASAPNPIAKKLAPIAQTIRFAQQNENHWETFASNFDIAQNNFLKRLKTEFTDLTQTNLQLCAYIRLNLSNKEIANLLFINPDSITKSKYRLKQKLKLSKDQDITVFLMNY